MDRRVRSRKRHCFLKHSCGEGLECGTEARSARLSLERLVACNVERVTVFWRIRSSLGAWVAVLLLAWNCEAAASVPGLFFSSRWEVSGEQGSLQAYSVQERVGKQ